MKKLFIILSLSIASIVQLLGQQSLFPSQYIHNRYAINPAFGGSREVLSTFISHRKKWLGFDDAPTMQYMSIHTPLKNRSVAIGGEIYNEQFAILANRGFSASYTYRSQIKNNTLALAIKAGFMMTSSEWNKLNTIDAQSDPVFENNETYYNPSVGFGAAYYGKKFFTGVSIPSFFNYLLYEDGKPELDFNAINYIATGGYLFTISNTIGIQPSFSTIYNPQFDPIIDGNLSIIVSDSFWLTAAYRTTEELIGIIGYQVNNQLRISYSLDYSMGEIATYNNGTHEISLQYDFGFKIKTASPKFF